MRNCDIPALRCCALAAIGLMVLGGCSLQRVGSDYGPGIKLNGLGPNFAWRPGFEPTPVDPNAPYFEVKDYTRKTIECALEKKGFTLTTFDTADFWLDYAYCSRVREDPFEPDVTWERSVLVVRVIDPASRQLIWRGWAESRVEEPTWPKPRRKAIRLAIHAIMDRFPYIPRYYVGETVGEEPALETAPVPPPPGVPPPPAVVAPEVPAAPCPQQTGPNANERPCR